MKKPARKIIGILLALIMCFGLVAACGGTEEPEAAPTPEPTPAPEPVVVTEEPPPPEPSELERKQAEYGLDENNRFIETRSIRVLTFDRDTGTDPQNNHFTNWIKENVLNDLNIEVDFYTWRRWGEDEDVVVELAAGTAPDMVMTFNQAAILQFAAQDAVINLEPYINSSQDLFPNLWDMLTWQWLYQNQDRETGEIFMIQGVQAFVQRTISFVREDWCAALGMSLPTSLEEFEAYLYACKENAELLLGSDANQILPLHMTEDIGWVAMPLIESFIPDSITDREYYETDIGGPRHFFHPGVKDAIRVLNKWYHDGLFHPDFALFASGADDTADNALKAGFVGAVAGHSWDQPYRDGETGWTGMMQAERGADANWIAVNTFKNDAGVYRKYLGGAGDRFIFVPATSNEPVAVLLYLDWLSRSETMFYLQAGVEGENHTVEANGAIRMLDVEPGSTYAMANPPRNYDLTPNMNGAHFGDMELASKSMALGYSGVDPRLVEIAFNVQNTDARYFAPSGLGTIDAEAEIGDAIRERSQSAWARAIVAPPDQFDAVYDAEFEILYNEFASASIAERQEKWVARYGDTDWIPTGD